MAKPSRTVGTRNYTETLYHVYYGAKNHPKNSITFYDEDAADKCFRKKQAANLHVEVYKEIIHTTSTVSKIV